MVRVKICGITNPEDARWSVQCGAWALGFIFYKKSPRYIQPANAKKIIHDLPPFITPVGVFVNETESNIKRIAFTCGIQVLQLHGEESPLFCQNLKKYRIIKAFRLKEGFDFSKVARYSVDAFLFDTYDEKQQGGTGKTFDWSMLADKNFEKPVILSGGLNPDNVDEAVEAVRPFAIDIGSGVEERPGKKNKELLKKLFAQRINSYA